MLSHVFQEQRNQSRVGDADDVEQGQRRLDEQSHKRRDGSPKVVPVELVQMRQKWCGGVRTTCLQDVVLSGPDPHCVVGAMEKTHPGGVVLKTFPVPREGIPLEMLRDESETWRALAVC